MSGIYATGGRQTIKALHFRDASNTGKVAGVARFRDASNSLKTWFASLSATVSPENVKAIINRGSSSGATTNAATASPVGGSSPYTYAWEDVGGDAGWSINNPTTATATFSIGLGPGETSSHQFRCKLTDVTGAIAYTPVVNATAINLGGGSNGPL